MAEARQAVAFQFAVTDEGVKLHVDRTAVRLASTALWRIGRRRLRRAYTSFLKGIFPGTPFSLLLVTGATFTCYYLGYDPTLGLLSAISQRLGELWSPVWSAGFLLLESSIVWSALCYAQRQALKFLLLYKGWMFDPRGRRSLTTKIWALSVKLVAGTAHPLLGSYQQSIPRLPVPSLDATCERYLSSVQPLMNREEFIETQRLAEEFKNGCGRKLQRVLVLRSWSPWTANYVTDWWERYVYLYWRKSIMINSNYYATDLLLCQHTTKQASRAAMLCYAGMKLKTCIEDESLKPLIIQDLIPLCSHQYQRTYGTCRVPGVESDELLHCDGAESQHVVAYHKGRWFTVPLYHRGTLLAPNQIEWQFEQILADTSAVTPGETHLGALTSAKRPFWAQVRNEYFSTGVNRQSMEAIEKAAFLIFFDDTIHNTELMAEDANVLSQYCGDLIHGKGYKCWFDKSVSLTIFGNARMGINAEHSWADAPIVGHMLEYCSDLEATYKYQEDGYCRDHGQLGDTLPPNPTRLQWDIPQPACEKIEEALVEAQVAIANLDLFVLYHAEFGKGAIKKCKISPDAFIQMALQLAYYKDSGDFSLTYEASMTRLYQQGRTETVRPCTVESSAFVKAMCSPESNDEERRSLLQIATDKHVKAYKDAMIGKGIDRHLFCLYVVSRGMNIASPFLEKVVSEPWKLSTSQTPTQQTGRLDYDKHPEKTPGGGGFGPVAEDGYGVSYIIVGEHTLFFHVSSFKSSPDTDSIRFARHIQQSLRGMIALFGVKP